MQVFIECSIINDPMPRQDASNPTGGDSELRDTEVSLPLKTPKETKKREPPQINPALDNWGERPIELLVPA